MGLKGNNDEEKIWNFLFEKFGNSIMVAALMGNLYAESGLKSNNLENTYNKLFNLTDEQYTNEVDNGTYTNFVKDCAGYGLAQWTFYSRKQNLYNFIKNDNLSIGSLEGQLNFLYYELTHSYNGLVNSILHTESLKEASDLVLCKFENPLNQNDSVKETRYGYCKNYYNKYSNCIITDEKQNTSNNTKKTFTIRTTAPEVGNVYYTNYKYGGINTCIVCGSNGFVLPNCVGYAHGRVLEVMGATAVDWKLPACNAEDWLETAKNNGMVTGTTPRVGSVVVWSKGQKHCGGDGAGHVAFVEQINSDGTMLISESGYKSFVFRTRTIATNYVPNGYALEGFIYPNGSYEVPITPSAEGATKSVEQLAQEVIEGKWGNGKERKTRLTAAGYNYAEVQSVVDKMLAPAQTSYLVRVKANVLNVRSRPSIENSVIIAQITDKGIYTIIDEENNFGKLKSGNGWVSLDWVEKI